MFAAEREREILTALRQQGRISVKNMARQLEVTPETVRRDLKELEQRSLLRRTHGGAVKLERLSFSTPVTARKGLHDEEKVAISRVAAELIEENSTIAIDAGTTTIHLAEAISHERRLTVVTYSLIVASTLAAHPNVTVHMLGGEVKTNSRATIGDWASNAIERITLDQVFLSVDGINEKHGLTTHNMGEAVVKSKLIDASRQAVVLADHSKLMREEFSRVASLELIDLIITDHNAPRNYIEKLEELGPDIVIADP